jgi:hypothetical protein
MLLFIVESRAIEKFEVFAARFTIRDRPQWVWQIDCTPGAFWGQTFPVRVRPCSSQTEPGTTERCERHRIDPDRAFKAKLAPYGTFSITPIGR